MSTFFLAGFECTDAIVADGRRLDLLEATGHRRSLESDYELMRAIGIDTVREGVGWRLSDRGGGFDFQWLNAVLRAARRTRVAVIHDLFHFGYPAGLDPFGSEFRERYVEYCVAATKRIRVETDGQIWLTLMNEPSFLAWAGGDVARFAPFATSRAYELKVNLLTALIAAIKAVRNIDPLARFLHVDPICRVVPPAGRPDLVAEADWFNDVAVPESFDILSGRILPALGGGPELVDTIGLSYYAMNQWELGSSGWLAEDDPRRVPLGQLIVGAWRRYGAPILIAETAGLGPDRGSWLVAQVREVLKAREAGVSVEGVCVYPVIGMPRWEGDGELAFGLFDRRDGNRVPDDGAIAALKGAQRAVSRFRSSR